MFHMSQTQVINKTDQDTHLGRTQAARLRRGMTGKIRKDEKSFQVTYATITGIRGVHYPKIYTNGGKDYQKKR